MNLAAGEEMLERLPRHRHADLRVGRRQPHADVLAVRSPTCSSSCSTPPRARRCRASAGPGITESDILVINKIDIAQYVRTDLAVMERDAHAVRDGRPVVLTNSLEGDGVQELHDLILDIWSASTAGTRRVTARRSCTAGRASSRPTSSRRGCPPRWPATAPGGGSLAVGSPGKVGVLELAFERAGPGGAGARSSCTTTRSRRCRSCGRCTTTRPAPTCPTRT